MSISLVRITRTLLVAAACLVMARIGFAQSQTPPKAPAQSTAKSPAQVVKPGLPAAVVSAFKQAYPNATIKNWSTEVEGGKTQFEVESMDGAIARDINYLADGTVLVIEESMDIAALPAPVSAAVARLYPKATVTKAEKVTTREKATQFEVSLKGTKVSEALFTPDGKPVK